MADYSVKTRNWLLGKAVAPVGLHEQLLRIEQDKTLPSPQQKEIFTGGTEEDFRAIGIGILRSLIRFDGLRPADKVIEIGSGLGRFAIPLSKWLEPSGQFVGYEIVRMAVEWCNQYVKPLHPGFEFKHLDLQNQYYNPSGMYYNPSGMLTVQDAVLPERNLDVAVFASIFTHLTRKTRNYTFAKCRNVLVSEEILEYMVPPKRFFPKPNY